MSYPSIAYESHADLGGQVGYGAVVPEAEGDLFHAAWEPRVLGLPLAMGASGAWNIDMSRAARETLPDYAQSTYYQIWLGALEKLLLERGLIGAPELAAGRMLEAPVPVARVHQQRRQLGPDRRDQPACGVDIALPREEPVLVHAGDLHGDPFGPRPEGPFAGDRNARLVQQRASRAGPSLGETLRRAGSEREAGINKAFGPVGHAVVGALAEIGRAHV